MTDLETVSLVGMRFHARVGILAHERELPQPVEVDVRVDRRARDAAELLDYRELYDVAATALAAPVEYLEEIAGGIADAVRQARPASRVRVAVRKPHVALPGPLAYAEVVVVRGALSEASDA